MKSEAAYSREIRLIALGQRGSTPVSKEAVSKTRVTVALALAVVLLSAVLFLALDRQAMYTSDDVDVLTVDGASFKFIREKPVINPNRGYMQALGTGVLTLQNDCFHLGEDGSVIIWPPRFTPHVNDGVVEVHNAKGQVVARVGDLLEIGGGGGPDIDTDDCSGPTFVDTHFE